MKIYTIGHSAHTLDQLIRLLDANSIKTLVDVRTTPNSHFHPQFNRENIEFFLLKSEIQYVFAGKSLGGRPDEPSCYKSHVLPSEGADYLHEVDYPEVMKKPWFLEGIDLLLKLAEEQTTAIMCSEEDPSLCHRHHLIAKYLMQTYPEVVVWHIRGDGTAYNAAMVLTSVQTESVKQLSLF